MYVFTRVLNLVYYCICICAVWYVYGIGLLYYVGMVCSKVVYVLCHIDICILVYYDILNQCWCQPCISYPRFLPFVYLDYLNWLLYTYSPWYYYCWPIVCYYILFCLLILNEKHPSTGYPNSILPSLYPPYYPYYPAYILACVPYTL